MTKSPAWMRLAQIGLGIIAIILSIYVIAFPGLTLITVALLLTVVLFVVGIERIISELFLAGKHRLTNVGLGMIVIILSITAMAFPVATGIFLLIFLAVALLFDNRSDSNSLIYNDNGISFLRCCFRKHSIIDITFNYWNTDDNLWCHRETLGIEKLDN